MIFVLKIKRDYYLLVVFFIFQNYEFFVFFLKNSENIDKNEGVDMGWITP